MKKFVMFVVCAVFLAMPMVSVADMGNVGLKSGDFEVTFFGRLKCYPTFMDNVDFNSNDTAMDQIGDELATDPYMSDYAIRNELRMGWLGKGENWGFMIVLESDFYLTKNNVDRTSGNFGIEKLNFTYDFGPFAIKAGWLDTFLDIKTGGLLYGDDHPYIGFTGKCGDNFSWEALHLFIYDDMDDSGGFIDGDSLDWKVYTFKGVYKMDNGFIISPIIAYSDNRAHNNAQVTYIGAETYGKIGKITPRAELIFAEGDNADYDISAWAAFAAAEIDVSPKFKPYFGINFMSGDDPDDDDINAFNSITNISRYTSTFGIENAIIYRTVPALGSVVYANDFSLIGTAGSGYGGVGNSSRADSPGLVSYGIGAKGACGKLGYKTQIIHMMFDEEDAVGANVDDEVGTEFDLRLTYKFNNHFTLGNTFAIFDPGDAISDRFGDDYDDMMVLNTVELIWAW